MTRLELKTASTVAVIFFCRMLGLFMVLPVLGLYGMELEGASMTLVGVAIGIYGLSQAFLQIPFALVSDVLGRKKVILFGLLLFLLGSIGASLVDDIYGLVFCRFLQGAGAIAGTSMAFLADSSQESSRAKVMAFVGIAIGASFVLAMVLGPLLASINGLKTIFQFSSMLAVLAILLVALFLKEPVTRQVAYAQKGQLADRLRYLASNRSVLFYSFSVMVLHLVMTSSFLVIPIVFEEYLAIERGAHWKLFISVFLVSILLMGPFARPSSDIHKLFRIYRFCAFLMVLVFAFLIFNYQNYYPFLLLLCVFFASFNLIEALLPAMLSIVVDEENRASAMGMYSSFQFFGAFIGGLVSGLILETLDIEYVFALSSLVFLLLSLVLMIVLNGKGDGSGGNLDSKIMPVERS